MRVIKRIDPEEDPDADTPEIAAIDREVEEELKAALRSGGP